MAKKDEAPKVYEIDINIDTNKIADALLYKPLDEEERFSYQRQVEKWQATPAEKRGKRPEPKLEKMTGAEFFKDIVMKAISQTHKTGSTASLRRTRAIEDQIDIAISKKKEKLELIEDDYEYIQRAVSKADDWMNTPEVARGVLAVEDAIMKAETL